MIFDLDDAPKTPTPRAWYRDSSGRPRWLDTGAFAKKADINADGETAAPAPKRAPKKKPIDAPAAKTSAKAAAAPVAPTPEPTRAQPAATTPPPPPAPPAAEPATAPAAPQPPAPTLDDLDLPAAPGPMETPASDDPGPFGDDPNPFAEPAAAAAPPQTAQDGRKPSETSKDTSAPPNGQHASAQEAGDGSTAPPLPPPIEEDGERPTHGDAKRFGEAPPLTPAQAAAADPLAQALGDAMANASGGLLVRLGSIGQDELVPLSASERQTLSSSWSAVIVRYLPALQTNHPELMALLAVSAGIVVLRVSGQAGPGVPKSELAARVADEQLGRDDDGPPTKPAKRVPPRPQPRPQPQPAPRGRPDDAPPPMPSARRSEAGEGPRAERLGGNELDNDDARDAVAAFNARGRANLSAGLAL